MADVQHVDVTSIHRFAYVSASDPGAIGAFKGWVDTSVSPYRFKIRNAGDTGWNDIGSDISTLVALAGTQSITGVKTFVNGLITDNITSINPGTANTAADNLIVKPSTGTGNAAGASATFGGAAAIGAVSHVGGNVTLIGGNGSPAGGGKGGDAIVQGGNGVSGTSNGGDVILSPGNTSGAAKGSVIIQRVSDVAKAIISTSLLSAVDRTYSLPDKTGTFAMTSDVGIGGSVPSGTAGSVLYVTTGPVLAQDNTSFKYSASLKRLQLFDSTFAPSSTTSFLTVAGTSLETSNDIIPVIINVDRLNSVSSPLNNIGISVTMNRSGILDTSASTVIGGQFLATTQNDSSTQSLISGVIGKALPYVATSNMTAGGWFSSEIIASGSGGSGNLSYAVGVYSLAQGNQGRTASVASAFLGQIKALSTGVITAARGLDLTGWSKGGSATIGTSYGIYADTTIDVGTTKYFIYSTSTSQSYFQGSLGLGVALPAAKFHSISTSEPARFGYDTSNYMSITVGSSGATSFGGTGAGAAFIFNNSVTVNGPLTVSGFTALFDNDLDLSGSNLLGTGTAVIGTIDMSAGGNLVGGTVTGVKFGTTTAQKFAFWNKTPIVQPTTGITGAAFVASAGTAVNDASTFGGYTIKQIAAALINMGILA